jgi:hypothetical protein
MALCITTAVNFRPLFLTTEFWLGNLRIEASGRRSALYSFEPLMELVRV